MGSASQSLGTDPLANLDQRGGDWGIEVDNGLVDPGETVRISATIPLDVAPEDLPKELEIHARYLEEPGLPVKRLSLSWNRSTDRRKWVAKAKYRPDKAGNYYASMLLNGQDLFSYFAVWKKGVTAVNLWTQMPVEYHAAGNLKDLYLPEIRLGHLPVDFELALVGEDVFGSDWKPRELFRRAQVETGAEVIPFFDGGYFHKLDPEFKGRFDAVTGRIGGRDGFVISPATLAVHGDRMLPDPNFHGLTVEQCSKIVSGAEAYWKEWGFRPFTGVSTYGPSNELVQSCRERGVTWISGIFSDYTFVDGGDRWKGGWAQYHRGMPSFPYLASTVDFRRAGKADRQGTMMFPGWQNFPVWDHEGRAGRHGTDPATYGWSPAEAIADRMLAYGKIFERDNRLAAPPFPVATTFCIQMNHPSNSYVLKGLIEQAKGGNLIFVHKRYLQSYFRTHHITASPDWAYEIPDKDMVGSSGNGFEFKNEAVWEGAQGKAAFISDPTSLLPNGRSIHLPVWWYDYAVAGPLPPRVNLPGVDLSGVSVEAVGGSLVVRSPKAFHGLPICLWDLGVGKRPSLAWIKKYRAVRVAAPERLGASATTWIIRPDVSVGEMQIPIP